MTSSEQTHMAENVTAVDDELDQLIEAWGHLRERGADRDECLIGVTNALLRSLPSSQDLLRLVARAVGRLAEGGGSS